jgi:DNA-binding NtrC family response regulator
MVVDDTGARQALAESERGFTGTADTIAAAAPSSPAGTAPAIIVPLGTPLSAAARELILSTLEHCGGERKRTAEMLGICTKTLYNRLREYGIREARGLSRGQSESDGTDGIARCGMASVPCNCATPSSGSASAESVEIA